MNSWKSAASFRLDREGKPSRSIDVRARRYRDGAFVACLRIPSASGDVTHRCEIDPRDAAETRQLLQATQNNLRKALQGRPVYDSVGYALDASTARIAPHVGGAVTAGAPVSWDVVGLDLNEILRAAGQVAGAVGGAIGGPAGQAVQSIGGALGGGGGGAAPAGAAGAAGGGNSGIQTAANVAGAVLGILGPLGQAAIQGQLANAPRQPQTVQEYQEHRDRALRELAAVAAAGTHPLGSDNWRGALNYHVDNYGITPIERSVLESDQSAIARLPTLSPWINPQQAPAAAPGSVAPRLGTSVASLQQRATGAGATLTPALQSTQAVAQAVQSGALRIAPGVAGEAVSQSPFANASLGAAELLSRALAQLAAENAQLGQSKLSEAAQIARIALRTVDATAGARIGDPRARAALRDAINASSDKIARGLRVGVALAGG